MSPPVVELNATVRSSLKPHTRWNGIRAVEHHVHGLEHNHRRSKQTTRSSRTVGWRHEKSQGVRSYQNLACLVPTTTPTQGNTNSSKSSNAYDHCAKRASSYTAKRVHFPHAEHVALLVSSPDASARSATRSGTPGRGPWTSFAPPAPMSTPMRPQARFHRRSTEKVERCQRDICFLQKTPTFSYVPGWFARATTGPTCFIFTSAAIPRPRPGRAKIMGACLPYKQHSPRFRAFRAIF